MSELLVDRLRWPSTLVRERAAAQLGDLIADGNQDACDALTKWVSRQELESLAAIGLLPFLRADSLNGAKLPSTEELESACKAKSVLSEMYLGQLDPSYTVRPGIGGHSGTPPDQWQARNAEPRRQASPISKNLLARLAIIEGGYLKPLTRQFNFEVSVLGESYGESPVNTFLAQGNVERVFHPVWHPRSTEIRLSAYLRMLAWAASIDLLAEDLVFEEAASVSPVDLALWGVKSTARPNWWPSLRSDRSSGKVDEEIVAVLRNVEGAVESLGSGPQVVLAASGCLSQTDHRQYDLEIRSFFQQPEGPDRPESQDLFEHLRTVRVSVKQEQTPLRFEGPVEVRTASKLLRDWSVVPCSGWTHPQATIVWQAWRGMRAIHCPSDTLAASGIRVVCREEVHRLPKC